MRGTVTGTKPGDSVEVWFEGGGQKSESFTYQMVSDTGNRMLVVAAEDYSGASPVQTLRLRTTRRPTSTRWPPTASPRTSTTSTRAAGPRRTSSACSATTRASSGTPGDDAVTRTAGRVPGNADRLALDEMLEMRAYMDEGGRVLYTGKQAGQQYTGAAVGTQFYDPKGEAACRPVDPAMDPRRCLVLRGSTQGGDLINDVLQYWFGGMVQIAGDGQDGTTPYPDQRHRQPVRRARPVVADGTGGGEHHVVVRDDERRAAGRRVPAVREPRLVAVGEAGRPVRPAHRQQVRLLADRRRDVQAAHARDRGAGRRRRPDVLDVVRHRGGLGLPRGRSEDGGRQRLDDAARRRPGHHTSQNTGQSCLVGNSGGWRTLHPHLDHYQTQTGATCTPTGTGGGAWNAASGSSNGWQQWSIDLDQYAGKTVEVSIAYISDWGTQNLGVFLDDFAWPGGGSTSFEGTDTGGWQITGPPAGSGTNANNFAFTDAGGFPVGASITTPKSLLFGYGFEAISTEAQRNAVMGRAAGYLLRYRRTRAAGGRFGGRRLRRA